MKFSGLITDGALSVEVERFPSVVSSPIFSMEIRVVASSSSPPPSEGGLALEERRVFSELLSKRKRVGPLCLVLVVGNSVECSYLVVNADIISMEEEVQQQGQNVWASPRRCMRKGF